MRNHIAGRAKRHLFMFLGLLAVVSPVMEISQAAARCRYVPKWVYGYAYEYVNGPKGHKELKYVNKLRQKQVLKCDPPRVAPPR